MEIRSDGATKLEFPSKYLEKFKPRAFEKGEPRTERQELIDAFLHQLNPPRMKAGFKVLTYAQLAGMLQGVPDTDLRDFLNECDRARNFSAYFWWATKGGKKRD